MRTLDSISALRSFVADNRGEGKTIAFVPTMGALHQGHLELVRCGLVKADICIPYIFVNPKQFAPHEDFGSYPRTVEADCEKLRNAGASAVYLPSPDEIYPDGFSTGISVSGVSEPLEGEFRPHFFSGVATIVAKMLLQSLPDIALFGEKDWQQLQVIKRMVADLNIPVEIIGVPIVRDENGLALSSRNAYLTQDQYQIATRMNKILKVMGQDILGGMPIEASEKKARQALLEAGFEKIDYIAARNAQTLLSPDKKDKNLRLLAAAWLGKARLIDNMGLNG
ncbi:MAG: pantoate--beta-alanine ligase [Micavibrio aeruginosavorus]|uniref:Pantothenate synthetase n=1 Tax=Micavibrio aeruginosavorus TaxID=349221 RepID=A0A2W5N1H5_9BACT|nr:MAG: pantoate--beta-alanine ligase [Micavibrio aeruginosavorus]